VTTVGGALKATLTAAKEKMVYSEGNAVSYRHPTAVNIQMHSPMFPHERPHPHPQTPPTAHHHHHRLPRAPFTCSTRTPKLVRAYPFIILTRTNTTLTKHVNIAKTKQTNKKPPQNNAEKSKKVHT
jgi:hypothetical protein